jgi:chromosome segregation ATPase
MAKYSQFRNVSQSLSNANSLDDYEPILDEKVSLQEKEIREIIEYVNSQEHQVYMNGIDKRLLFGLVETQMTEEMATEIARANRQSEEIRNEVTAAFKQIKMMKQTIDGQQEIIEKIKRENIKIQMMSPYIKKGG